VLARIAVVLQTVGLLFAHTAMALRRLVEGAKFLVALALAVFALVLSVCYI
jgi:ABC-type antimicrobial peptide transport system ATPase subunit